jgi:hypothetical protein
MGVAWWVEHRETERLHDELVRRIEWKPAGPGPMSVNDLRAP